jgi:PAN-like domain.
MRSPLIAAVAALFSLGVGTAAAISPTLPQSASFTRESGMDRPGNDLGSVAVGLGDVNACMAVCAANSQCNAYTLYTPANSSQSYCWYKHTAGPARPAAESISGVRQVAQPAAQPQAQNRSYRLSNGRTLGLPATVPNCVVAASESQADRAQITYNCPQLGNAEVQLVVIPPEGVAPLALLQTWATEWEAGFMSWPTEQRATFLRRETRTMANGASAAFQCLTYDNVRELNGSNYCFLDLPQVEFMISADANMASDATNAVNAVLRQLGYR